MLGDDGGVEDTRGVYKYLTSGDEEIEEVNDNVSLIRGAHIFGSCFDKQWISTISLITILIS